MKFSASIEIDATPEKAWSLVENIEEWPQWISSLKKIRKVTEDPLRVGSQIQITARYIVTVNLLMTITDFIPARHVMMEGTVFGVKMSRYYHLEPEGQKTRFTLGGEVSGLLAWFVCRGGQRVSIKIAESLKERIETLTHQPS